MYDYLVYFDKENKVQPNLAESWEIQNDGAVVVFKLRKGVKFHNGREVVADDVKYSMERLKDQKSVFARDYAAIQKSGRRSRPPSSSTSRSRSPASFGCSASSRAARSSRRRPSSRTATSRGPGMGTGPFMFDHWTPGSEIVLKKNPNYWKPGAAVPGRHHLQDHPRRGRHRRGPADRRRPAHADPRLHQHPRPPVRPERHRLQMPRVQDGVVAMYVNARIGHARRSEGPRGALLGVRPRRRREDRHGRPGHRDRPDQPDGHPVDAARRRGQEVVAARPRHGEEAVARPRRAASTRTASRPRSGPTPPPAGASTRPRSSPQTPRRSGSTAKW